MSPCILVQNSRKPSSDHHGRASELRTLSCGLCGRSFECHGLPSCWCREIKLTRIQLKEITEVASDCICPTCLQESAHQSMRMGSVEPMRSLIGTKRPSG
ncbi:hypothetical protein E6H16_07070 [Candidatus Bathyarchaeota archaeon]|nr:MAG: hypothetical protein E6H16_07070 [Candidatus Bathyarchaeota archaeon]